MNPATVLNLYEIPLCHASWLLVEKIFWWWTWFDDYMTMINTLLLCAVVWIITWWWNCVPCVVQTIACFQFLFHSHDWLRMLVMIIVHVMSMLLFEFLMNMKLTLLQFVAKPIPCPGILPISWLNCCWIMCCVFWSSHFVLLLGTT